MANIEQKVETLLKPKVEELGYRLYDVEYAKEGKNYFLRVFIDKKDGIDIDDCEKVNDGIMDLLDEADYIKEPYFLEVSSPGVERILRKEKHLEFEIKKICKEVLKTKVEVKLDPMNSYERRIVHNVVSKFDKLYSESEGEAPNRYTVIKCKED